MTFGYTRTCVLCSSKINGRTKLCTPCYMHYQKYTDTVWFKELEKMQRDQDAIDRIESMPLHTYATEKEYYAIKKDIGHPSTDKKIQQQVLDIFDLHQEQNKEITTKEIMALIQYKITLPTIRKILYKYRKFRPKKTGRPRKDK